MTGTGREAAAAPAAERMRIFAPGSAHGRFRRATDVVLLVPALAALAVLVAVYPPSRFEKALIGLIAGTPGWFDPAWRILYNLLMLWALGLVVSALATRRLRVAADAGVAAAVALGLGVVCWRLAIGSWPDLGNAILDRTSPAYPAVRLAAAAAVVFVLGPALVKPVRSMSHWIVWLGALGALFASPVPPSGDLASLLIAAVAAAAVRLALGTTSGRPSVEAVQRALADLRVQTQALTPADRQPTGVFELRGSDAGGRPLLVKVLGRDAYDSQLLTKLWRTMWYQDPGPGLRLSRAQVAEHEAFVTLLARNGGTPTHEVVTAATTARDDSLLVLRGEARGIGALPPGEVDDGLLLALWRALGQLHASGIAHLRLDPETVAVVGGRAGFVDFSGATASPHPEQQLTDGAQLLVTTATVVGPERALAAADASLGKEGVAALVPYLQDPALGGRLREAVKAAGLDAKALREQVAQAIDVPVPEPVKLRRFTWWTLIQTVLLVVAASAVISFATGIDWQQLKTSLENASWAWIAAGFVVAQTPRFTQALSTLGTTVKDLRYGPVYVMQLATDYMNLALPSYAGRLAVSIRFFQCQGLTTPEAITSGAIDSVASTFVQAVGIGVLLLFSEADLDLSFAAPSGGSLTLVWILLGLLVATILVVTLVGRVRRKALDLVHTWVPQIRDALGALRRGNKLTYLLLGNVGTEILFAVTLGIFVHALGYHVGFADLLVVNMSVSLLGSFIPVPGGIGVVEFGLTVGLTAAGMPEEAALAAALLQRIATFYLPPIWGFFALRWLQRHRYL